MIYIYINFIVMTNPQINQIGYFDPRASKKSKAYLVHTDKGKCYKCHFSENQDIEIYDVINLGTITRIKATIYN